jgi:NAD(P) transhydrogenase subunit alpha
MRPGSVVVDLAAEQGGNCELTRPGEVVTHGGVKIVGYTDLPSRLAAQASQLYGTNIAHLLDDLGGAKEFRIDLDDEVVRGATVVHRGKTIWPPPKREEPAKVAAPPKKVEPKPVVAPSTKPEPEPEAARPAARKKDQQRSPWWLIVSGLALLAIGFGAPESFLSHLTVFVLAIFVGWQVIWNVKPALHTPLMSVTNAISGIILIGGMLQISGSPSSATVLLGAVAILVATINVAGGFLVTQRMLQMFRK